MAFRSVENDSDLMKEGEYEVYVKDCCNTETKSGTECIKFEFVVREDIEQPYKGKHYFKNFYRDRETGSWPKEKIGKYANALGISVGQEFELDDLIGCSAVMKIKHFVTDDGETIDCIHYLKKSKQTPYISYEKPSMEEIDDLDDGELPF